MAFRIHTEYVTAVVLETCPVFDLRVFYPHRWMSRAVTRRRTTFHSGAHLIFKVYDQSTMDNNFNSATKKTRIRILEIMEKNIKHYLQAKCSANLSSVSTVDA